MKWLARTMPYDSRRRYMAAWGVLELHQLGHHTSDGLGQLALHKIGHNSSEPRGTPNIWI
jgi:hypothetical protein